jgi:hypothetical protein
MKTDTASNPNARTSFIGFFVSPEFKARLIERAKRHERNLSSELRWLLAREID